MWNFISHVADLLQLTQPVIGKVRRLHQERMAGQSALQLEDLLFGGVFDTTLSRLSGGDIQQSWWQNLLSTIGGTYVTPDFLREREVQQWLEEPQVKQDLKNLAWAILIAKDPREIRQRLREKFFEITQEAEYLADPLMDVILLILLAGYLSEMSHGERLIMASLKESHAEAASLQQGMDELLNRVAPDALTVQAHDDQALQELHGIQQRRAFSLQVREEIQQLAQRVESGDLKYASPQVQAQVFHWAARLLVTQPENLDRVKRFRDKLRQLTPSADTRIVEALIVEAEGEPEAALRALRDIDDADARTVFFLLLSRVRGQVAALEWWSEQEERNKPDFLTGLGRSAIATALMGEGRWEDASEYLSAVHEQHDDWPELYFLEGAATTALLLPPDLRRFALEANLFHKAMHPAEGLEADRLRDHSTASFQRAEQVLETIFPVRASAARHWLLWLRLTHPNPEVSQAAREQLQERLRDPKNAVDLLDVALDFDIPFDEDQLWRYLDQRSKLGGLGGNELIARFLLAEKRLSPRDFLSFLEQEESRLNQVLDNGRISLARIQALVEDGQAAKARDLLEARGKEFDDADRQRIGIMIGEKEGEDPRPKLEVAYQQTHDLFDLHHLVNHLRKVRDWSALRPRLEELFQQEHTLQNALRLVDCMNRDPCTGQVDLLNFLRANQDLVDREPDLQSAKSWALFEAGRLQEAKEINDHLRSTRSETSDLHLEINLALQTGGWEQFPGIVEREWPRREEHSPEILLRLADLAAAADVTSDRAFELATLAVSKGSNDPHVLASAVPLVHRLGREGEYLREWFASAIALSSEEGPIIAFDTPTLMNEWMPAYQEQAQSINDNLLHGAVPLHFAATRLNMPLSTLLLGIPDQNYRNQDARRRLVIPIISGARSPVDIQPDWAIGLDTTSLLVLHYLGLLRKVLSSFRRVVLASETMIFLLNERTQNRFHQPSRVKAAEEILALIDSGRLLPMESLPSPPEWLAEEVGRDLAQLLQAAQDQEGVVVRPKPICRMRNITEEADLQTYGLRVLSTVAFENLLFNQGHIDTETHEKAARYLLSQDREENDRSDTSVLACPIYLDNLAISYLQSAGVLTTLVGCGFDLRVHPSLKEEKNSLIARSRQGERLVQEIDRIRTTLREAIQDRKVVFLPRNASRENEDEHLGGLVSLLSEFLQDSGPCDAICIDDRFTNRNTTLMDRHGRAIPVICVLDILRCLEAHSDLDLNGRLAALHRLRQSGFAIVPVELDELEHRLSSVRWKEEGAGQESVELRTLRQMLAKIRSLNMLNLPVEAAFLGRHRLAVTLMIRQLWENEEVSIERAVYLSHWLWHHISPSPLDWLQDNSPNEQAVGALAHHMTLLFQPMFSLRSERMTAFHQWVEEYILGPLLPANATIVDRLAVLVRQQIAEWSTNIALAIRDDNN